MGGRVCAQEVAARTSTPKKRQRIVVARPNAVMEGSPQCCTRVLPLSPCAGAESITSSMAIIGQSRPLEQRHVAPEALSIIRSYRQLEVPPAQRGRKSALVQL